MFFFCINRPPPVSTRTAPLFPYTTLFRSVGVVTAMARSRLARTCTCDPCRPEKLKWYCPAIKSAIAGPAPRSEEHTSELQSLMRSSYAVLCLKKKKYQNHKSDLQTIIHISKHVLYCQYKNMITNHTA